MKGVIFLIHAIVTSSVLGLILWFVFLVGAYYWYGTIGRMKFLRSSTNVHSFWNFEWLSSPHFTLYEDIAVRSKRAFGIGCSAGLLLVLF